MAQSKRPTRRSFSSAEYASSPLRLRLKIFYDSEVMMSILTVLVIFSVVLVVIETDAEAQDEEISVWLRVANFLMIFVFICELVGRIFVERWRFPKKFLNLVDAVVVVIDFCRLTFGSHISSAFLTLRAMRLVRLGTSMCVMVYFPELAHMIRGMIGALKALFWGTVLILFVLTIWGILATQILHPRNMELTRAGVWADAGCERCPRAFESVYQSMLTFTQQIIAGDSWGQLSVPIIENYPETFIFFIIVLLSVQLACINLILAVVLDKATESRQQTERELLEQKQESSELARRRAIEVCKDLDKDCSGCLSFQEIMAGFQQNEDFQNNLKVMDIEREDLELVFHMMDEDMSNSVDYTEFATNLFKMRNMEMHTMIVFIRYYVSDLWRRARGEARQQPSGSLSRKGTFGQQHVDSEAQKGAAAAANVVPDAPSQEPPAGRAEQKFVAMEEDRASPGMSSWSAKVEKVLPLAEPKLPQPVHSEELAKLRKDLEVSLGGFFDKLEAHTKMLESLPLLLDRSIDLSGPGSLLPGVDGLPLVPLGVDSPAILREGAPLRSEPQRRPKKERPTTLICCQSSQEEVRRLR